MPKGIMLSNMNFISEGIQVSEWGKLSGADSILAIFPIFHGFGLGVCVNACFMGGGKTILIPQFTPETVAQIISSKKPSFVIGVPTLFDALSRNPKIYKTDLSCLRATFSGADTLPRPVKERFEGAVKKQGGNVQLLEGYGLTEAVTAIMSMPIMNTGKAVSEFPSRICWRKLSGWTPPKRLPAARKEKSAFPARPS